MAIRNMSVLVIISAHWHSTTNIEGYREYKSLYCFKSNIKQKGFGMSLFRNLFVYELRSELNQIAILELFIRRYNCTFVFFKNEILNFFRMQYFYKRFYCFFIFVTFVYGNDIHIW